MRLYIDVCCINRPLDDQSQSRVRLEADAVETILQMCSDGAHKWVVSPFMDAETARIPDAVRHGIVSGMLRFAGDHAVVDAPCVALAQRLIEGGLHAMDAAQVAAAQLSCCNGYLTTDDRLLEVTER